MTTRLSSIFLKIVRGITACKEGVVVSFMIKARVILYDVMHGFFK